MGYATDSVLVNARKAHICSWCGQHIEPKTSYRKWAWFDEGTAITIKMHLECYACTEHGEEFELYEQGRPEVSGNE